MDFNKLIERAKGIIISPATEWEKINTETDDNNSIVINFAVPLITLAAITTLIGSMFFNKQFSPSISYSIVSAIITFGISIGSIYLSALIINEIAPSFGTTKNLNNMFKLVVYSSTPAYLAAIIANLHVSLGLIGLFGLYSVYLFWLGVSQIIKVPEEKKVGFVIVSFLALLGVYLILALLVGSVILGTLSTFK